MSRKLPRIYHRVLFWLYESGRLRSLTHEIVNECWILVPGLPELTTPTNKLLGVLCFPHSSISFATLRICNSSHRASIQSQPTNGDLLTPALAPAGAAKSHLRVRSHVTEAYHRRVSGRSPLLSRIRTNTLPQHTMPQTTPSHPHKPPSPLRSGPRNLPVAQHLQTAGRLRQTMAVRTRRQEPCSDPPLTHRPRRLAALPG